MIFITLYIYVNDELKRYTAIFYFVSCVIKKRNYFYVKDAYLLDATIFFVLKGS